MSERITESRLRVLEGGSHETDCLVAEVRRLRAIILAEDNAAGGCYSSEGLAEAEAIRAEEGK